MKSLEFADTTHSLLGSKVHVFVITPSCQRAKLSRGALNKQ